MANRAINSHPCLTSRINGGETADFSERITNSQDNPAFTKIRSSLSLSIRRARSTTGRGEGTFTLSASMGFKPSWWFHQVLKWFSPPSLRPGRSDVARLSCRSVASEQLSTTSRYARAAPLHCAPTGTRMDGSSPAATGHVTCSREPWRWSSCFVSGGVACHCHGPDANGPNSCAE